MREPEIITYKQKQIVYLDFTDLKKKEEILALEEKGCQYIRKQNLKSVLTLSNMEGMFFNNEIKSYFEVEVKANAPYVKASAVIGLSGLISLFYKGFVVITGRDVRSFSSKEDALEYLVNK
jgi:hypothetical protein